MRLDAFYEKKILSTPQSSQTDSSCLRTISQGGLGLKRRVLVVLCMYGVLKSGKFGPAAATDFREGEKRKLFLFCAKLRVFGHETIFPRVKTVAPLTVPHCTAFVFSRSNCEYFMHTCRRGERDMHTIKCRLVLQTFESLVSIPWLAFANFLVR